jgi:hypothetical protein
LAEFELPAPAVAADALRKLITPLLRAGPEAVEQSPPGGVVKYEILIQHNP